MNYIGKRVRHASWGEGTIVGGDANLIEEQFPNRPAPARFKAPGCFAGFLELLDAQTAAAVRSEIEASERQRRSAEATRAHSAALRLMESHSERGGARLPSYADCEAYFADQERALIAEIAFLKAHGGKRVRVFNGERVERRRGVFVYAFETESELNYPDGTQITLWRGDASIPATLLGCEELAVYVASEEDLGERVASIEFSAEP